MKSIDFDPVADLYDEYVTTDLDHAFWRARIATCPSPALELMCGTGRITLAMLKAGLRVEGLDYSHGLLGRFREKLRDEGLSTELHEVDARTFDLGKRYGLIYIGFNAISEVLDDADKGEVLTRCMKHLQERGELWITVHNPPIRMQTIDGVERPIGHGAIELEDDQTLDARVRFARDAQTGWITGEQTFVVSRNGHTLRRIVQPVRFHLIEPDAMDRLLTKAGFRVVHRFGDYESRPFDAATSPYCIFGCART